MKTSAVPGIFLTPALLAVIVLGASAVEGQQTATVNFTERSNWLVGYVAAPPRQMLGFGAAATFRTLNGWGFILDGRITTDSPGRDESLLDISRSAADAMDVWTLDKDAWSTVTIGIVKGLTPEFAGYFGGGVSWKTAYSRYLDESRERGDLGHYWVEDEAESRVYPNVHGGVFFRMGDHLVIQFGGQSAPMGVITGAHLRVH
ncbi:MAG: hypothetical protein ACOCUZ_02480 [bacterium]